jgi:hypothetical protein
LKKERERVESDPGPLNREERYVTVDIGVPKSWWEKLPPNAVAENIRNALTTGLIDMIAFIEDRDVHVDKETILFDFSDALKNA